MKLPTHPAPPSDFYTINHTCKYRSHYGEIGKVSNQFSTWHSCRELFHFYSKGDETAIYFGTRNPTRLIKLVQYVEILLNLRKGTKFYQCKGEKSARLLHNDPILLIQFDPFWFSTKTRAYFFTTLLRAIEIGTQKNPIERIMSGSYFISTHLATALFLSGYTAIQPKQSHWQWHKRFAVYNHSPMKILCRPYLQSDLKHFKNQSTICRLSKQERETISLLLSPVEQDIFKRATNRKTKDNIYVY